MSEKDGDQFQGRVAGASVGNLKPVVQSGPDGAHELLNGLVSEGVITPCIRDGFVASKTPTQYIKAYASQLRAAKKTP